LSKRRTSPISATKVTATMKETPRIRLVGRDHRRHRPARHDGEELLIEAAQMGGGVFDRIDRILEDNLLRRVCELLVNRTLHGEDTVECTNVSM
jgi:hypothetical protein